MIEFIKKNPVLAAIFAGAAFFGLRYAFRQRSPVINIPGVLPSVPIGWKPDALVYKLYKAMQGLSIPGIRPETEAALKELYELPNDSQVISVYYSFNKFFQKSSGQTLTEWIKGEWLSTFGYGSNVLDRLQRLGLP